MFFASRIHWIRSGCFTRGTSGKGGGLDWYWNGRGIVPIFRAFKIEDGSHKLDFVQKYNYELSSFRACLKSTFVGCDQLSG